MTEANTDVLSTDSILSLGAQAIRSDGEAPPNLKNPYEAIALVGHACMIAVGFRLVGLGEDHCIGMCVFFQLLEKSPG